MSSLPKLKEFYEQHEDDRDKFEILAFSDKSVRSFAEIEEKLASVTKDKDWNFSELPYPILIDGGKTFKAWAVQSLPTAVIIDPDGKVHAVFQSSEKALELFEQLLRS